MLNRFVKVLTNRPTTITKPVFTKEFNKNNKQIEELENLLQKASGKPRVFIENDINKLKYGSIGENNIYYELKNSFMPIVCLHDVRIEYDALVAQIDFVVITTKNIFVIECKNLIGDISVNNKGEFIRYKKNTYGKVVSKEGMYSPIVQNERHINVLKELLKDKLGYKQKLKRIESLVVIANPKTVINKKYAPKDISNKIIRYDQLINYISDIEQNKKIDWLFIEEDMMNISDCLKKYHKDVEIDYISKYSLDNEIEDDKYVKVNNDDEIRCSLKEYRLKKSNEENIKAYMVFNNDTMEELINLKPKNIQELEKVKGFGPVKSSKYGADLINIITN
ncbi:MAG: NERD domain-containing protein [Paraclostridium sp.]|uniref:NERD domain-containing protein n=1 Tax=Paraclostridium sp. TaxID=2023273 RepID=UPI003F2DF1C0